MEASDGSEERRVHPPRRSTDNHLHMADHQLALAVEASNLGIFYCPIPLGKIEWNATCKEHFWLPPDAEIDFDLFYSIIHPEDRERTRQAVEAAVFQQQDYDIEYRTVSPQGEIKWIRAIGRSFRNEEGVPVRFDGVTLDITGAKRNQAVLEEKREKLEAITAQLRFLDELSEAKRAAASPEDVMQIVTKQLGRHLQVSRCAYAPVEEDEDMFTIPGDYCEGCQSIKGRYSLRAFGDEVAATLRSGRTVIINDTQQLDPGAAKMFRTLEIDAVICASLLKQGKLAALMAVHQTTPRVWRKDEAHLLEEVIERSWNTIARVESALAMETQREQLLAAERAARTEAERAGKLKDEFLATLSHELRTPLSAIVGWCQLLASKDREPEVMEGLEVITRNARMQTQIIEDLLDMNRIITGKIRLTVGPVNLATTIQAAIKTVQPAAAAKNISLKAVLDPSIHVQGDASRLQQVLWNLLSNAIKFTPREGHIQVILQRINSHLEVSVLDDGEGIDPEFIDHVFERFQQADASHTRRHGGLGLGLAIVRQLVELHGGSVSARSEGIGRGADFTVKLPLAPVDYPDAEAEESVHVAAANLSTKPFIRLDGIKVLVVDDEPDARDVTKRLLIQCGATVDTAADAAEGFAQLQQLKPDVLVCDIGMPGEDGLSLIRRIRQLPREAGGNTPAMALTAYARVEDRVASINAGFQMHTSKPISAAELVAVVASLVQRHPARNSDQHPS